MGGDTWNYLMDPFSLTGWKQQKDSKKAIETATAQNAAAMQAAKESAVTSTAAASTQAQEAIAKKKRAMASSQSVYTSPLGLSGQASTAKKLLLGQ